MPIVLERSEPAYTCTRRCIQTPRIYLRVDRVSLWLTPAGEIVAIMIVLELPPRLSFKSHVRTESLKKLLVVLVGSSKRLPTR